MNVEAKPSLGDGGETQATPDSARSQATPTRARRNAVTLRDVAKLAEVDTSTASRALRKSTRNLVRADTVERVLAVAAELGYRVNPVAKGLREQRTMTVGMILPDLSNPLFPPIVRGIEDGLREAGYALILANTDRNPAREQDLLGVLLARQVDGLILATAELDYPLLDEIVDLLPVVLVNRTTEEFVVSSVAADDHQGIGQALRHLVDLGHTRIAHVAGSLNFSTGSRRYQEYLGWMQRFGLKVDSSLVVFSKGLTQAQGEEACQELLSRDTKATAILAGSDLIALGCYDALRSKGLRIPEDVSVVGYNGIRFCNAFSPPLTSVHIPKYDIGLRAAALILEGINKPGSPAGAVLLPTTLQVRSSTKALIRKRSE
ncbi:MAG TPA: LacI family DNA-binding transcriptional regulator [Candidatus Nanopelagicaceae bacterium]|nr:LacI family DNA-binding transcriptional regulator [Candidatus Nanopelagicaceae bacterium]